MWKRYLLQLNNSCKGQGYEEAALLELGSSQLCTVHVPAYGGPIWIKGALGQSKRYAVSASLALGHCRLRGWTVSCSAETESLVCPLGGPALLFPSLYPGVAKAVAAPERSVRNSVLIRQEPSAWR